MPAGLRRYPQTKNFHFVTFSCYRRQPFLEADAAKDTAERILGETRRRHDLRIAAYVRYIHRNPVTRGLVSHSEEYRWSSFNHYASGELGTVDIESEWTARRRERVAD